MIADTDSLLLEARTALSRVLAADDGNILVEPLREHIIAYLVSGDFTRPAGGYMPPSYSFGPPAASLILWCTYFANVTLDYLVKNARKYIEARTKELHQKLDDHERRHLSR